MISPGENWVMTVIGFGVSTMFIVFICTRLACARIQINASRRSSSFPIPSILERGLRGIEPSVVANFPTKKYSGTFLSNSKDAQCTICLSEYHEEDILRILPYCTHSFHANCIDKWLQQHPTCPVCRISLRQFPEKKHMQPMSSSFIRTHCAMESLDTNYYHHHLLHAPSISSRAHDHLRMEPIQENQFATEGDGVEAGDTICISIEGSQSTKEFGNKHLESPSNP